MMNHSIQESTPAKGLARASLLKIGRSWKILSLAVIVLLSVGLAVIAYGQAEESQSWAGSLQAPFESLRGFGFLMLLTVGYLVGKSFSSSRSQQRLIDQLLEEEAIARARRLDPMTQFHHPEVCRDILIRQANHAARLHAPVSILELTIPNFGKLSLNPEFRPLSEGLTRQIKRFCRPIDSLLRWSADSFLLVFPEVAHTELPAIRSRIHQELIQWCEQHFDPSSCPELLWTSLTTDDLTSSGDILLQTQRLLEERKRTSRSNASSNPLPSRRSKSVGLALTLQVQGKDPLGNCFQEAIVTERVATDRIWFTLNTDIAEQTPLTIVAPDGAFQHVATVIHRVKRGEEQLVEARFDKPPEQWVVRGM
ncbi:MAG: hypothetical protein HY647_09080 [Acidobacteria bacterium]|nr:hypothetical protein [Acidobacteriota bacterium]